MRRAAGLGEAGSSARAARPGGPSGRARRSRRRSAVRRAGRSRSPTGSEQAAALSTGDQPRHPHRLQRAAVVDRRRRRRPAPPASRPATAHSRLARAGSSAPVPRSADGAMSPARSGGRSRGRSSPAVTLAVRAGADVLRIHDRSSLQRCGWRADRPCLGGSLLAASGDRDRPARRDGRSSPRAPSPTARPAWSRCPRRSTPASPRPCGAPASPRSTAINCKGSKPQSTRTW